MSTNYNEGKRGGKIRVRAIIEELDKKTLVIRSVPYGVTTTQLMESIVKANDQGKIKIKKVTDNTAAEVEIIIDWRRAFHLISPSMPCMHLPIVK